MSIRKKKLTKGSIISYKVPVLKGDEGRFFYQWINRQHSINGLITKALKLQFMLDTIQGQKAVSQFKEETLCQSPIFQVKDEKSDIRPKTLPQNYGEIVDIEHLKRMLQSVNRK
ncbi:hypothetical protein [Geosporobacter ferrireducens]|uniref:hypothetical protein n=1 Tax=Geosporobacter ferrireducens TaxID=1424294 RepID=UPI00139EB838|nr:hypothetical protein [Geosporobacter ferrireducens]MTI53810.1 hypothetical protein [Geosporobacter ferrireducens]